MEKKNDPNSENYVCRLVIASILHQNIDAKKCFTCGSEPTNGIGEHVIPKWVQSRYNLFDQRLILLNGSRIPYRKLTIPCCSECNTGFLSRIEIGTQRIFDKASIEDDEDALCLARWLSKILIGILIKETSLAFDRKNPTIGNIVPSEFLEDWMFCQLLLQSSRKKSNFSSLHSKYPFSLYWYPIDCEERDFYLATSIAGFAIAVMAGKLGVVFVQDGGLQMHVSDRDPYGMAGKKVSPIQFKELAARIITKATLRDATHLYANSETPDCLNINQMRVRPYSNTLLENGENRIFLPWDSVKFSIIAANLTGLAETVFYDPLNGEKTLLPNSLA